ncbi:ParA family protein [Paludisphaera soli]|uniref:ParA family protein n=1 Tax=Paludisphaera soli TaxID=2712865 RepID=UPI0013EB0E41|nr:ParA family protein [Paludisphaera soli]
MRSIAFVSEKGGVAKTSSVLNVAAVLGGQGSRVLVVDTDPQGNASFVLLKGEKPRRPSLFDVLVEGDGADEAIVASHFKGVDVLPADATLADAAVVLAGEIGRERRLCAAIEGVADRYDFVLVDTAPTRSLLTTNVLTTVEELIVPFNPGIFGVLGLGQLQDDVAQVRRYLGNTKLRIAGVVVTLAERNNVCRDLEDQLRAAFGGLVFDTKVPRSIKIEEAHARHESVITYAPTSVGATAYKALTREIINGRAKDRIVDPGGNPPTDRAA